MALSADLLRQIAFEPFPFNFRAFGIVLSVVPSDATLYIEIERAPDTGSNQPNVGAAVSIVTGFSVPPSGGLYRDVLPPDGARRFYRARQHGPGYDPGPWTAWTLGYKPVQLPKDITLFVLPPMPPGVLTPLMATGDDAITQPNIAPEAVGEPEIQDLAVARRSLGPLPIDDLANSVSRNRFLNPGAEDLRAYWNSNPSGQFNTTLTIVNDFNVITGGFSFKLTHTGGATESFYQARDGGQDATDPGNWVLFRVKPGSRIQIGYKAFVSGANVIARVLLTEFGSGGGTLGESQVGTDLISLTPEEREIEYTVPTSVHYVVVKFASAGSSSGYVIYDDLSFVDLVPFTDTLMDWKNLGLKSGAFQVDWREGWSQYAEINGTNLAITLVNPEPGGRYRLYLKQNSQPDTVTWPANIKWQNNTTPTLSTTTGRIDRITLEWTGAVYIGQMEQWWPETEQVILPSGIGSAQAFGTTIVDRPHVDPSGIASAQALGSPEVVRDDPVPDITDATLSWTSGGDLCAASGNFVMTVAWTTVDAPDGTYHITIDGFGGTTEPSVGSRGSLDSGVGPQNLDPPHTEQLQIGPYTVRLRRDSDSGIVDTFVTNAVFVDYQLGFCL